jgi:iron complex outermembrane receptor protein
VQDTLTLEPEKWFLTIGSKLEHNDYTGFELQPSARLLWKPNKQNSFWGAVSRAVSTPSRLEINTRVTNVAGPAELVLSGNPDQRSEELLAYELGYRFEPVQNVSVDLAAFYNNYDRLRSIELGSPRFGPPVIIPAHWNNDFTGETYGGEISAKWRVTDRWRLEGSYSLLEARFAGDDAIDEKTASNTTSSAPRHQAQLHSYWDITRNVQLNASTFYVGSVRAFNVPAYISTDLNLTWRPKESLEFTVGVLNLFDNHHPEFGVTGGQGVASETPRTFYGQMTYRY